MIYVLNVFLIVICLVGLYLPHRLSPRVFLGLSGGLWLLGFLLVSSSVLTMLPLAGLITAISFCYRHLPRQRVIHGVLLLCCLVWQNEQAAFEFHSWLTIDKPFAILSLAYALGDTRLPRLHIKPIAWLFLLGLPLFMLYAWWALELTFAPHWDESTTQKLIQNLLFTCIPEELLFRAWLQRSLGNKLQNHWLALLIMSLLFGLAHIRFGFTFALVASAAGLLYGASYLLGGHLVWAVIMHFAVNASRLVFFSG